MITPAELAALRASGARITQVEAAGPDVTWRVDDAELYILVVRVDLRAIDHVDVEYCSVDGAPQAIYRDAPFSRTDGTVTLCCDRHVAAAHERIRFRVLGRGAGEGRVLADCVVTNVR